MSGEPIMGWAAPREASPAREFPLRAGKIGRPSLPHETLRRDRLLDWLAAKIHRRVLFVVAEAGFGKTTLLADFARRSRLRTVWYRLDEEDTDALVFLRYLVAACRAVDRSLLPLSAALLADSSGGPITWQQVLEAVLRESEPLGDQPTILVLDDFHLAERAPAVREVVERLLQRAPERLTFVFASRRAPELSVARLRARDELAELSRDELRFDPAETERLFRDAYREPLEPDVLRDLHSRTEGWVASLQLVKTAVRGRTALEIREFIQGLSGAEGDLYDFLAEEVVGDLPDDLRAFLMRVSLLDELEPPVVSVAAGVSATDGRRLLREAQRLGLASRGSRAVRNGRIHPLVRQFLAARLETEVGEQAVADLHRHIARSMETRSWRVAARHWAAANESEDVRRVVAAAVPTILGTGDYTAAEDFITRFATPQPNPWFDIVRSRLMVARGQWDQAMTLMRRFGEDVTDDGLVRQLAALNAVQVAAAASDGEGMSAGVASLLNSGHDRELRSIGSALEASIDSIRQGSLDICRERITSTMGLSRALGHSRYRGISLLNMADVDRARSSFVTGLEYAHEAMHLLGSVGTRDELAAAQVTAANALAHLGRWQEAMDTANLALETDNRAWVDPALHVEVAEIHALYGDVRDAQHVLAQIHDRTVLDKGISSFVLARIEMRLGNVDEARRQLRVALAQTPFVPGYRSGCLSLASQLSALSTSRQPDLDDLAVGALTHAKNQQAWYWWKIALIASASNGAARKLDEAIRLVATDDRAYLSINAEALVRRLPDMSAESRLLLEAEAEARPLRWRETLRNELKSGRDGTSSLVAGILERIGEAQDIQLLRSRFPSDRRRPRAVGRSLIRRLAARVFVEDLGRVVVTVGERTIPGTEMRRKVLSLLCFLLTRPQFSATRDQVLDALWPSLDPPTAANSLNQTAYFLRRVFEPEYAEEMSAGYLRNENDLIWLDPELVSSRSAQCLGLMKLMPRDPDPGEVLKLAREYAGRFALDFAYEDWASGFRESIHARYLEIVEHAVSSDTAAGAYDRAIVLAQLAIAADPDAEDIELSLLRLYRLTGALSAAAEQYSHYVAVLGDLGLEAPPLDSL